MKTNRKQKQKILKPSGAFTLIEMIGVLAVIAILAALLIPKVYEAINNARVNNAAVSCETVKTALADHYAKFNALNVDGSQTPPVVIPNANMPALIDPILLKEQFLDKLFQVKIGDGTFGSNTTAHVEVNVCPLAVAVDGTGNTGYNLSGTGATNELVGSYMVQAVIPNVVEADAQALSARMDGVGLSVTTAGTADFKGRVKYAATTNGVATVYVYLTHR